MAYFINYGGMENAFLAEENRQRQLQNLIQNFPNFNVNPELSDPAKQLGFQTEEEYQEYVRQQAEQKRQAQLEEEKQRARQRELEYLNQYEPDKENIEKRRNFLSLPDEKKVELLRAGKVNDKQYIEDIDNKSYAELEMEYGTSTAEYARNKHLEQLQRANTLLAQQPEYSKGGYWEDVRGFGSGISQTLHGIDDNFEIRKIKNDDSLTPLEKEQRLREHEQKVIARTSASNEWVGSRYEDSYQLNLVLRDLYDEKYKEEYQRAYAKTGNEEISKQIASREANQVYKDADTLTREFFIQGSGNQVPQLVVAAITAPIGGYALGALGKGAGALYTRLSASTLTNKALQLSANNFKNKDWITSTFRLVDRNKDALNAKRRLQSIVINNEGAKEKVLTTLGSRRLKTIHSPDKLEARIKSIVNTHNQRMALNQARGYAVGQLVGGSASASYAFGKQSEMSAYSQTVLRGLDEFRKLEPEKQEEMLSSPQMQGFRESYIELTGNENPSDEEIVAYALDTAGQKAGDRAFDTTFRTSMVSMPFFQMIWRPSSLGNIAPKSVIGKLGLLAGDAGIQGWQEKNQETTEGLAPREEANIATGYELYKDTMKYGLETTSNQGALLAMAFTGASGGLKTGYNLARGVFESNFTEEGKLRKNIKNIEKKLQKQDKERNIKIKNIDNDLNNLNNDAKFNIQLDEIKTQVNELLNNKNQKTVSSNGQTLQTVYDLIDNINTRLEQLDSLSDAEKQEQKNIDEKNNLIDTLGYISLSLEKLINSTIEDSQSFSQTLKDNKQRLSEIDQIINNLNNVIPQLKNDFDNNVITEDAYNATLNDINTQLNDLNEEKNNLTTLNKELSDKILNISNFGHTDTFNQLVQTKDKLDQQQIVAKNINISDIPFANIPIVSYSSSNVISKIQNSTSEEEANNIILGWFKGFRQSVNKKLSNINGKFNVSDVDNFYNDLTKIQQELNNKGYSNVLLDGITTTIKTLQDTINSSPKALLKINNNGDIADDSTVMVILSKLLLGINEIAGEKRNLPSVLEIAHQMLSFKERTKGSYNAFRLLTTQRAKLDAIQNIVNNPSSYTEGSKIAVGTNPDGSPIYLMKKGKKQGSKNNDDYVNFTSTVGKNGIKKEWTEYAENFLSLLEIEAQLIENLLSNILSLREQVFQAKYINKPQGGNQGGNQGGTPPVSNTPPSGTLPPSPSSSGSNTQGNQTQGNNIQPITNTQPQPKKVSKKTQPKPKVDVKKQQQQRRIKAFEDKVIKAQDEKTRTKNWKTLTADKELAQLNPPRKVSSDYQSGQGFIEYTIEFKQERPANGDSIESKLKEKFGDFLNIKWEQKQSQQQQNPITSSTSIPRHMRSSLFNGKHKFANVADIRKEILRIIDEKDEQAWNELLDYLENDASSISIDKETVAKLREIGIPTELFFDDDSSKAINNQGTLTGGIELNYDSKNLNNTEKRNIQIFFNRLLNADYAINNPDTKNIMVMFKPKNQNTSSNTGSKKKIIKNIRKPNNKVINSEKDKVENIQDRDFVIRDFGQLKKDWVKERLDNGKTDEEIIQEIYDNFDLNRYTPKQLEYLDKHLENELARIKKELNYQNNQNNVEENNQTQEENRNLLEKSIDNQSQIIWNDFVDKIFKSEPELADKIKNNINVPYLIQDGNTLRLSSNSLTKEEQQKVKDIIKNTTGLKVDFMGDMSKSDFSFDRTKVKQGTQPKVKNDYEVNIYSGSGDNIHLSNFAQVPVKFRGKIFANVEAAFQYQKLKYADKNSKLNKEIEKQLLDPNITGAKARELGRKIEGLDVEKWDSISYSHLKSAMKASFLSNRERLVSLLLTKDLILTHKNKYGKDADNGNFVKALNELRAEFLKNITSFEFIDNPNKFVELLNDENIDLKEISNESFKKSIEVEDKKSADFSKERNLNKLKVEISNISDLTDSAKNFLDKAILKDYENGVLTFQIEKQPNKLMLNKLEQQISDLLGEPVKIEIDRGKENKVENKPAEKTKPVQPELPIDTGSKQTTEKQPSNIGSEKPTQKIETEITNTEPTKEEVDDTVSVKKEITLDDVKNLNLDENLKKQIISLVNDEKDYNEILDILIQQELKNSKNKINNEDIIEQEYIEILNEFFSVLNENSNDNIDYNEIYTKVLDKVFTEEDLEVLSEKNIEIIDVKDAPNILSRPVSINAFKDIKLIKDTEEHIQEKAVDALEALFENKVIDLLDEGQHIKKEHYNLKLRSLVNYGIVEISPITKKDGDIDRVIGYKIDKIHSDMIVKNSDGSINKRATLLNMQNNEQLSKTMFSNGYNIATGKITENIGSFGDNIDIKLLIKSLDSFIIDNNNIENIKNILKSLDKNISETTLTNLVNKDNIEKTKEYINLYIEIFKNVDDFLHNNNNIVLSSEPISDNYAGLSDFLDSFNSFVQLGRVYKNSKTNTKTVMFDASIIAGFSLSFINYIDNVSSRGNSSDSSFRDWINEAYGSDVELSIDITTADVASNKNIEKIKERSSITNPEDLSILGENRENAVVSAGNTLFKKLGIKFTTNNLEEDIKQSFINGLGLEFLNFLQARKLLNTFNLNIQKNDGEIVIVPYVNSVLNINDNIPNAQTVNSSEKDGGKKLNKSIYLLQRISKAKTNNSNSSIIYVSDVFATPSKSTSGIINIDNQKAISTNTNAGDITNLKVFVKTNKRTVKQKIVLVNPTFKDIEDYINYVSSEIIEIKTKTKNKDGKEVVKKEEKVKDVYVLNNNVEILAENNVNALWFYVENFDNNFNALVSSSLKVSNLKDSEIHKVLFNEELKENKKYIPVKDDENSLEVARSNGLKSASAKDVSDKLFSNQINKEVEENINNHNQTKFKLDTEMVKLIETSDGLEIIERLNNYTDTTIDDNIPKDKHIDLNYTQKYKESVKSRNNSIDRSIEEAQNLIKQARDISGSDDVSGVSFYINHKFTENQRTMQEASENPQSNKIIREILKVQSNELNDTQIEKIISDIDQKIGLESTTYNEDELRAILKNSAGTITVGDFDAINTSKDKKTSKNNARSLENLIDEVIAYPEKIKELERNNVEKEEIQKLRQDYFNKHNFILALAQALAVKVEKSLTANIYTELKEKYDKNKQFFDDITYDIFRIITAKNKKVKSNNLELYTQLNLMFDTSYKGVKNGTMRAFSALKALSMYMYSEPQSNIKINLYIEADGLSNFMSNLIRQFGTIMSSNYFRIQEKIGSGSITTILEILKNKNIILDKEMLRKSLTSQEINDLLKSLEGTAGIYSGRKIEDIYQTLSSQITKEFKNDLLSLQHEEIYTQIQKYLTNILGEIDDIKLYHLLDSKFLETLQNNTDRENMSGYNKVANVAGILQKITKMFIIDGTISQTEEAKRNNRLMDLDYFMNVLLETSLNNLDTLTNSPMFDLVISRNFSKIILTPAGYGGGQEGINNQFFIDYQKGMYYFVDNLYKGLTCLSDLNNIEKLKKIIKDYNTDIKELVKLKKSLNKNDKDYNEKFNEYSAKISQLENDLYIYTFSLNNLKQFLVHNNIIKNIFDFDIKNADIYLEKTLNVLDVNSKYLELFAQLNDIEVSNLNNQIIQIKDTFNLDDIVKVKKDLNAISNVFFNNKEIISSTLKAELGKYFNDVIKERTYKDIFNITQKTISFDEVSVDIFTLELDKQIRGAIEKRNEKYAENDPRRHSLLSQKEINKIMKNILALPSIAGAFGHNVKLLESLIEEGHSIISVEKVKSSNIPPQFGAGSFFTKLGGKNPDKVSIFTANINFKLKKYFAGGATNLTNTLVSTESMVQAIISKICNELGLGVLNVYDGIDALYALAPLFSILANDAYNKIHQQTNLLEQFFHRLNRSNIISYIYSDAQLKNLFNKYQENYTIKLSREDIVFLKSLMYIINSSELENIHADILSIMKISDFSLFQNNENTINFQSLQKFLSDISKDLILSGVDYMYVEDKDLYILLETLSNLDDFHKHISELYTILLQDFRNNAVEAYAREKIEDKHLTYIFNQYAGSGRGIISNVEQLFKDSGTLQRFLEFSEKHRDDFIEIDSNDKEIYFHDADIYQKLEYFINNDFDDKNNSITRDLDEFRREKINELVLNTENVSISEDIVKSSFESSKTKLTDKKVSLNKFVSYIYNEHFHNREFDNNNFLQNTTRVILINAGRLLEGLNQDINLYINKEEFLSACKKANINNVKIDETTDGLYVKGVGIYIDVSVGKDTLKALTHELVHYIFDSFLSLYYGYSDKNLQKKLEDEYKAFTDPTKKNNINLIIKDFKNIAFNLEQEAIKFAKSFAFDPRVIKFLNDLSFISDKNRYINDNLFIADQSDETAIMAKLASAILFAFNDKEGREYVSPEIKQKVLSEFLAYALSERSILNRLAYTKENDIVRKFEKREKETAKELAKKGIKSEYKTNPFIYLKEIAQKAKLLIDSIKKSLGKLFFGKSYNYKDREQNEIFNSSLFNILGSMQITVSKKLAIKNNIDKHFVIPDNQPIIFYSQSSNKSSIQHQKYLDNLFNSFKENVRYNDKINNNEIAENIFNRKVEIADKENTIVKLRNTGIPISFQEEYMYSLMSSVYNLAFKNENPTLKRLSTQLIHKLINKLNTVNNLTEEQLNLIFRNSVKYNNTFDLANTLSLLTTVEPIKNIFNKLLEEEKIDDYNKNIFYQISTKIRELANKDLLEDISYKAIKLDIAKSIDYNRQQEILSENYNEVLIKTNFAHNVKEKLDNSKIPEKFQYILASGVEEIVLGSLANNSFKYSDGVFGEWLQNFTNKLAIKNGNFLGFFGNIFRWIFQARLNTVDIYDRRNKAAAQIERIRQNYITVIPEYLKSLFKPNTFNEEVDKVIYNNVLKPRLHNIYNNITGSNSEKLNFLKEYITNENSRKERIKEIYSELEDNVEQVFNMLQGYNIHFNKQVIINYLKWQSMGLAQLMITGSANRLSKQSLISNDILPNSKAIASLNDLIVKTANYNLYKSLKNNMQIKKDIEYDIETLTLPELYEDRINLLKPLVDELVSLHSLRLLDKNELNILADNIEKNPKALTVIFNTLSDIDTKYSENAPASLLGYDGYTHSSNTYNNIDIRLVNSDEEKQIKNLEKLDYYKYQEITTGDDISFYVMVSHNYIGERFQTGILNLTEQTVNGASVKTRNKLNSIQTYYDYVERLNEKLPNTNFLKLYSKDAQNALQEYDKSFDNFIEEKKDYFDSCINLNISEDGIPVYTFINLPDKIKERINPTQQKSLDSLGKLNGRIFEEYIVNKNNIKNIQALNELYDQDYKHRNQYFYVSVEKTKKGNYKVFIDLPNDTNKEKQYLRKIKNLIKSLPKDSLDYIIEKGLWLNRIEIDNILGYNHITVLDLYSLKEKLPNEVKKGLIAFSNIFSNNKFKNFLYKGEKFIQEQVSVAKDFILNRSIKVSLSNMLSNILHLTSLGISPEFIQTYGKEGLLNSIQYQKDYGDLQKIIFQLSVENLNDKEKNILEIKQQFLIKSLRDNPIRALIKAGIFSNISTEIYFENTLINSKPEEISVLEEMIDKTPLKGEPKQMYKNIINNKIVSNILINKQSSMHNFMENVLNYGDFISKYILLRHLIDKKGFSIQNAMNVIREEFVNYSMNRGAVFDYLNSMGLTWFLSYFTGIQKVIWRRMRTNFLGMLSVYSAGKIIDDPFGLIQTVPEQNIFEKNWDYATSPSNIWNSYESHYLNNVWDIIF